jgi:hypothetical protein
MWNGGRRNSLGVPLDRVGDVTLAAKRPIFTYLDHDHCLSVLGNAVLSFSLQPPHPRFLAMWTGAVDQVVAASDGPISVIIVIDSLSRAPDEVSKRAILNTVLRHRTAIGAFAYTIEGHGFGAAALRSAVSLISLAARYPFPQKVFKTVADGAVWTLGHVPSSAAHGVTVKAICVTVDAMRDAVKQQLANAI